MDDVDDLSTTNKKKVYKISWLIYNSVEQTELICYDTKKYLIIHI